MKAEGAGVTIQPKAPILVAAEVTRPSYDAHRSLRLVTSAATDRSSVCGSSATMLLPGWNAAPGRVLRERESNDAVRPFDRLRPPRAGVEGRGPAPTLRRRTVHSIEAAGVRESVSDVFVRRGGVRAPGARHQRAFTLFEVLLALALFGVAVVVLASSYINVLNSLELVKVDQALEQELAFARSQVLLEADLETLEKGGEIPTLTHGLATWQVQVAPTAVADLFRIDLVVELEGNSEEVPARSVTQTLYLLRPDWSEPVERDTLRAETRKRLDEIKKFRPL